ncbi:hypothetical protein ACER0C_009737 [Sarotherodon galilaeus]
MATSAKPTKKKIAPLLRSRLTQLSKGVPAAPCAEPTTFSFNGGDPNQCGAEYTIEMYNFPVEHLKTEDCKERTLIYSEHLKNNKPVLQHIESKTCSSSSDTIRDCFESPLLSSLDKNKLCQPPQQAMLMIVPEHILNNTMGISDFTQVVGFYTLEMEGRRVRAFPKTKQARGHPSDDETDITLARPDPSPLILGPDALMRPVIRRCLLFSVFFLSSVSSYHLSYGLFKVYSLRSTQPCPPALSAAGAAATLYPSAWFYVPLFHFEHPPLQISLHGPAIHTLAIVREDFPRLSWNA